MRINLENTNLLFDVTVLAKVSLTAVNAMKWLEKVDLLTDSECAVPETDNRNGQHGLLMRK